MLAKGPQPGNDNDYYDDDIGNTDDSNDNFDDVDDANQRWFTSRCKRLLDSPIPDDDIAARLTIRTHG